MLYIIGLGLSSPKDITLAGLEAIQNSQKIYLESYTSYLMDANLSDLQALYDTEVKIEIADRDMVETQADIILEAAKTQNVSFLVVGDPFGATTHTDLLLRCTELGIQYQTFHNASILNAVGSTGLSLYNFGQTVSVPFFVRDWKPKSWIDRIFENLNLNLHTLLLLDIKVKEQSEENLARGRKIYEPPRYMSVPVAIQQLFSVLDSTSSTNDDEDSKPITNHNNKLSTHSDGDLIPTPNHTDQTQTQPITHQISNLELQSNPNLDPHTTLAISVSRVGSPSQSFHAGSLFQLSNLDPQAFGEPLHSLIIIGKRLNPIERDFMTQFAIDRDEWLRLTTEVYQCA